MSDAIDRCLCRTVHVHELDAPRPVLDQFLAESFTGNDDSVQGRVMLGRNDGENTGSAVDDVNPKFLDGPSDITRHELLTPRDESSTTGQGTKNIDDERIESVGEGGENANATMVPVWVRVLHQIRDRAVLDHDTLGLAGTSTREPIWEIQRSSGREDGKRN